MGSRSKSHMTLSPREDLKIALSSPKVPLLSHLPSLEQLKNLVNGQEQVTFDIFPEKHEVKKDYKSIIIFKKREISSFEELKKLMEQDLEKVDLKKVTKISPQFLGQPTSRQDAVTLKTWYETIQPQIESQADLQKVVLDIAIKEMCRQVSVQCKERGQFLCSLFDHFYKYLQSIQVENQASIQFLEKQKDHKFQ